MPSPQEFTRRKRSGAIPGCTISFIIVLLALLAIWVGTGALKPSHPVAPSALDPNTEVTKKELIFRYLPRTPYEFEKIAAGTGWLNPHDSTKVVEFRWVMSVNGDGEIVIALDQNLPENVIKSIRNRSSENSRWSTVNDFYASGRSIPGYIHAPNDWIRRNLHDKIAITDLVRTYEMRLGDENIGISTKERFPLSPSGVLESTPISNKREGAR